MKIGNRDVSTWHAEQWAVTIENHEVINESDWIRGSPGPYLSRNTIGFKTIKVTLKIRDKGREAMTRDRSGILAALLEPVELVLDKFTNHFMVSLKNHSFEETVVYRQDLWHKLSLELIGYEFGAEQTKTGISNLAVENPGNLITPAVVEILPTLGAASIKLTGICRNPETGADEPVTVKDLQTGQKVVLDGESGLITQGGALKAGDVEIWELPALKPGSNTITCSNDKMQVTVKYKPRYM